MKGRFWEKTLAAALALLLVSGNVPIQPLSQVFERAAITASANDVQTSVTYLDENGEEHTLTPSEYTIVTSTTTSWGTGTYVVKDDVTINSQVRLNGNVNLILCDGKELTINTERDSGIYYGDLTVYGQSNGSNAGKLTVSSTYVGGINVNNLTINGGNCTISCGGTGITANNTTLNKGIVNVTGQGYGIIPINKLTFAGATVTANTYSAYNGTIEVAEGMHYIDSSGNLYEGKLTSRQIDTIGWKAIAPAYAVNLPESTTGGSISADKSFVAANAEDKTVTLNVAPDEGYAVKSVKYNDTEITPVNGVYSFTMPDEDVTVSVEFEAMNIINSANITLGGELGLNFYLTIPDDAVTAGAKVVMNGPEGEKKVALSSLSKDNKGRYKLTYKIKAVYMNENVSLNVTDPDGNTLDLFKASGSQVDNNTLVYSIYDYVQSAKADTSLTEKEHNMVDTMYTYGAYSAKWFNGTALPDDVKEPNALNKSDYEKYKLQTDGSSSSITLTGLSLILDSNTALRLYFTSADDISGHSAKVDGVDLTIHPTETADKYYVEIDDISSNNLISNYSIVFDGTYTATVSTMTYVYNSLKNGTTDDVMNVLKALCAYSDAVNKS